MTKRRADIRCPRDPVGLSFEEVAAFVGVSTSLFRRAVSEGKMPCPHRLFGRLVWDADEVAVFLRRTPRDTSWLNPGVLPPHDDPPDEEERWKTTT